MGKRSGGDARHDCRRRTHGNPKYGDGVCAKSGGLRPAVQERVDWKRYVRGREWEDEQ